MATVSRLSVSVGDGVEREVSVDVMSDDTDLKKYIQTKCTTFETKVSLIASIDPPTCSL